jgi:hypothetical protein
MKKQFIVQVRSMFAHGRWPAGIIAVFLFAGGPAVLAGDGHPEKGPPGKVEIIPPNAHPHGLSYAEWTVKWWKWAVSMPVDRHPLTDTAPCNANQSGDVHFLGGSFTSSEVVRNCNVPTGKALFFPILNTECSTIEPDPFHGDTAKELRDCAKGWVDGATGICTIDGMPVQHLEKYRVQSPMFTFGPLPENNVLFITVPPGTTGQSVSDGFWLMLAPLPKGPHTIEFIGVFASGFAFHITYHLTVSDPPDVVAPRAHPPGKNYGEWSAKWWQWAYSLPGTDHPLVDQTGADVAAGQSGKVWFLGGTYSAVSEGDAIVGRATRVCTIPAGKSLFFPILNSEANNFTVDAGGNMITPTTLTEADLRATCAFNMDHARNMTCTIDGWPVKGLDDVLRTHYRAESPVFQYTVPAGDSLYELWGMHIFGQTPPPGAVADGVYVMLEPLDPGHHTIYFTGEIFIPGATPAENFLFRLEIWYDITVTAAHH